MEDIKLGERFGKLTVIKCNLPNANGRGNSNFLCRCDCGNEKLVGRSFLRNGLIKSCGCLLKSPIEVGQRFGKLVAVKPNYSRDAKTHQLLTLCKCDCGKERDIYSTRLVQGLISSCGCEWRSEIEAGQRFGKLVVVKTRVRQDENGAYYHLCKCDCGGTREVQTSKLNDGRIRDCGCEFKKRIEEARIEVGTRFGRLVVIDNSEEYRSQKGIASKCRCDCGNEVIVSNTELRGGRRTSCGCYLRDKKANALIPNGTRFGRLVVIDNSIPSGKNKQSMCRVRCDCGKVFDVIQYSLKCGNTKSCGCLSVDRMTKHGQSRTRLYRIWKGIRDRCTNEKSHYSDRYVKRGISMCKEWEDWETFRKWSMDNGYTDKLTIDRIDNDGNYEPSNCRWVTMLEQNNNKSNVVRISYCGEEHTIAEWARIKGLPFNTVYTRIKAKWDLREVFETPNGMVRGWRR